MSRRSRPLRLATRLSCFASTSRPAASVESAVASTVSCTTQRASTKTSSSSGYGPSARASLEIEADRHKPDIETDGLKYDGFRFRAEAKLAGKLYGQRFGVDVAFGDPILDAPETVVADDLFGFAGIAPPTLRLYPPFESAAAESGMTRAIAAIKSFRVMADPFGKQEELRFGMPPSQLI